jgi:hypothetical protein
LGVAVGNELIIGQVMVFGVDSAAGCGVFAKQHGEQPLATSTSPKGRATSKHIFYYDGADVVAKCETEVLEPWLLISAFKLHSMSLDIIETVTVRRCDSTPTALGNSPR